MGIAHAAEVSARGGGFAMLIPLLLMGLVWGVFLAILAKRKGRNRTVWFLIAWVPGINLLGGVWLASLTDVSVVEAINALQRQKT